MIMDQNKYIIRMLSIPVIKEINVLLVTLIHLFLIFIALP